MNCTFTGNSALVGGGVYTENASPTFINCVFYNNSAFAGGAAGGGLYLYGGSPKLINCTVAKNAAGSDGGGLGGFGSTVLTNCIVWGNTAPQRPQIGLGATVTYSCVEGGYSGTGNISQDPQFVDFNAGDLRILPASPCTESGKTAALPPDSGDSDGDGDTAEAIPLDLGAAPRVAGAAVDMGATEQQNPQPPPASPTGLTATAVSSTQIDLQWDVHPDPNVASYNVFRSLTAGFTPSLSNRIAAGVAGTAFSDTGLINGFRYYYRITAFVSGVGESAPSDEASARAISIPEILYVKAGAAPGGDGTSWANAFAYVQSALAVAAPDDQIWVAAGTYLPTEGVSSTDPRGVSFQLKSGVALYGGFPGQPGQEGDFAVRDWRTIASTLSGNLGDPNNPSDNSLHVVNANGVDATAIIDGFTITGGAAGGLVANRDNVGGGMRVQFASPTIRNCTFFKSWALVGGGMFISSGSPLVSNCRFLENYSGGGGDSGAGIYNDAASPTIVNCVFIANTRAAGSTTAT